MNPLWSCVFFVLAAVAGAVHGPQEDYSDYAVYRFNSADHPTLVKDVIEPLTDDYDVWTRSNKFIDIKLPKKIGEQVKDGHVILDDMDQLIQDTLPTEHMMARDQAVFESDYDFFFNEYRDLDTIYMWLDLLERSFPNLVNVEHLGKTFENRELKALHISGNNPESNPEKKTIVITGGIHAREWISVSTVCWTIYQLLNRYGSSKKETKYLDNLDFLIIPVFNPDGYAYTWSHDRLWRKNRQRTHVPQCFGIDIDHSFGFQWEKAHTHACSEEYSGETPFEALEASAWNKYINETKGDYKIYGYIDMHSYSQENIVSLRIFMRCLAQRLGKPVGIVVWLIQGHTFKVGQKLRRDFRMQGPWLRHIPWPWCWFCLGFYVPPQGALGVPIEIEGHGESWVFTTPGAHQTCR